MSRNVLFIRFVVCLILITIVCREGQRTRRLFCDFYALLGYQSIDLRAENSNRNKGIERLIADSIQSSELKSGLRESRRIALILGLIYIY